MIKMIVNMQFLLSLEMYKIMNFELNHDEMSKDQENMDLSCLCDNYNFWHKS